VVTYVSEECIISTPPTMIGENEKHTKIWLEYTKKTHSLGGLIIDCRIILKCILNKQYLRGWTEFIWLRAGSRGGLLCT
jgi:hypothetical protein